MQWNSTHQHHPVEFGEFFLAENDGNHEELKTKRSCSQWSSADLSSVDTKSSEKKKQNQTRMTTTWSPRRTAEKCNSTTIHKNNQVVKNKLFIMIIRYTSSTFLCLQKAQSLRHILRYGPIIVIPLCFAYFFKKKLIISSFEKSIKDKLVRYSR